MTAAIAWGGFSVQSMSSLSKTLKIDRGPFISCRCSVVVVVLKALKHGCITSNWKRALLWDMNDSWRTKLETFQHISKLLTTQHVLMETERQDVCMFRIMTTLERDRGSTLAPLTQADDDKIILVGFRYWPLIEVANWDAYSKDDYNRHHEYAEDVAWKTKEEE